MARPAKASLVTASVAGVALTTRTHASGRGRRSAAAGAPAHSVLRRALDAPELLSVADVQVLQRSIGNHATARLLGPRSGVGTGTTNGPATLQRWPASTVRSSIVQRNGSFSGEGRKLSESTFKDDEERDSERKAAFARAQERYSGGQAPFGGPVDDSNAFSGLGARGQSPAPNKSAFTGEGHRLSDWSFEDDEDRDSERRASVATAQGRYGANLAPFEGEMDIAKVPWAPSTQEPWSLPSRESAHLANAIRSRRPFSSGAKESDIDPVAHIESLIPSSPSHGPMQSELRKRRQFASGASDKYVELKSARAALQPEVASTIRKRRREQPQSVGKLERLWIWTTADIDDSPDDTEHRFRQLPQIEALLIAIESAHSQSKIARQQASQRHIQELLRDIAGLSGQVGLLLKVNYGLLSAKPAWMKEYEDATQYFGILRGDILSQTVENLEPLSRRWKNIHITAQQEITSAAGSSTKAVKIGFDPTDATDRKTIYGFYSQTGGIAPQGQVMTVCQMANKFGGTYSYDGKSYNMYHDSHGVGEGFATGSRTAWKILIDGKLQVVGIGRHEGPVTYKAIFPYSADASVKVYGPSPTITDSRK